MRPVIFRSTKFCQGLPNFKDAVVLPWSRTNFCQAWNLSDLSIYTPCFEGTCQSRKSDLYFWSEYFSPKPAKIKFIFVRQPNDKHGWFVPWYAPGGSVRAIVTITVPKSTLTFLLHLRDQALLILYIRTSTRVSRVHPKAAKLRILGKGKTRAEKGAKVQRNKRQSTTRLSQRKSGIW